MRKTFCLLAFAVGCGLLAASALGSMSQTPPPNTFRWSLTVDIDHIDPALAYYAPTWALMYATGANLFNYPDAPAPRGSRLVPEVAASFPSVSTDGRTYTFRLKKTYRLSNGKPITARNFARALFRVAHPQPIVGSPQAIVDIASGDPARAPLPPSMLQTLLLALAAFTLLYVAFVRARYRLAVEQDARDARRAA